MGRRKGEEMVSLSMRVAWLVLLFLALSCSKEEDDWCAHQWHQRVDSELYRASTREYELRCAPELTDLGEGESPLQTMQKGAQEILEARGELIRYKKKTKQVVDAVFKKLAICEAKVPSATAPGPIRAVSSSKGEANPAVAVSSSKGEANPAVPKAKPPIRSGATGNEWGKDGWERHGSVWVNKREAIIREDETDTGCVSELHAPGGSGLVNPWVVPSPNFKLELMSGEGLRYRHTPDEIRVNRGPNGDTFQNPVTAPFIWAENVDATMSRFFYWMQTVGLYFCGPVIHTYCDCAIPNGNDSRQGVKSRGCGSTLKSRFNNVCCGPADAAVCCKRVNGKIIGKGCKKDREESGKELGEEFFGSTFKKATKSFKKVTKSVKKVANSAKRLGKKFGGKAFNMLKGGTKFLWKMMWKVIRKLGIVKVLKKFAFRHFTKLWNIILPKMLTKMFKMHIGDMARLCARDMGPLLDTRFVTVAIPMTEWHWSDMTDDAWPGGLQDLVTKHSGVMHYTNATYQDRKLCMPPENLIQCTTANSFTSGIHQGFGSDRVVRLYQKRQHKDCRPEVNGKPLPRGKMEDGYEVDGYPTYAEDPALPDILKMKGLPPFIDMSQDGSKIEVSESGWNSNINAKIMKSRVLMNETEKLAQINRFRNNQYYAVLLERRMDLTGTMGNDGEPMGNDDEGNYPLMCAASLSMQSMLCTRCCCKKGQVVAVKNKNNMLFTQWGSTKSCDAWFVQMVAVAQAVIGLARTFIAIQISFGECNKYVTAAKECASYEMESNSVYAAMTAQNFQCGKCIGAGGKWRRLADDPYQATSSVCTDDEGNLKWERTHQCNLAKMHLDGGKPKPKYVYCYDCRVPKNKIECGTVMTTENENHGEQNNDLWNLLPEYRDGTPAQAKAVQTYDETLKTWGSPAMALPGPDGTAKIIPQGKVRIQGRTDLNSAANAEYLNNYMLHTMLLDKKVA